MFDCSLLCNRSYLPSVAYSFALNTVSGCIELPGNICNAEKKLNF